MSRNYKISAEQIELALPAAIDLIQRAGALAMEFRKAGNFKIYTKPDNSRVTDADLALHDYITAELPDIIPGVTVVSEEDKQHPKVKHGEPYWTVDPIDYTEGFIKGIQFYVQATLIDQGVPVLAVIGAPYRDTTIWAARDGKSYIEDKLNGASGPQEIFTKAVTGDKLSLLGRGVFDSNVAMDETIKRLGARGLTVDSSDANKIPADDLPSFVQIAMGHADMYITSGSKPDLIEGNGYSWDYAPNWLILRNAGEGGAMIDVVSGKEAEFFEPATRMNALIGVGDKKKAEQFFPSYGISC